MSTWTRVRTLPRTWPTEERWLAKMAGGSGLKSRMTGLRWSRAAARRRPSTAPER
uniref:Uncharacterized protein n=1 Tax=Arundo donax TaxID=35708 RepID=A0A0A8YHJ9_ARUDO